VILMSPSSSPQWAIIGPFIVVAGALIRIFIRGVTAPKRFNREYRDEIRTALAAIDAQFASILSDVVSVIYRTATPRRGFLSAGTPTLLQLQAATAASLTNPLLQEVATLFAARYELSGAVPALVQKSRVQGGAAFVALAFGATLVVGEAFPQLDFSAALNLALTSGISVGLAIAGFSWFLRTQQENKLGELVTTFR